MGWRKQFKRPKLVLMTGWVLILLPVFNIAGLYLHFGIVPSSVQEAVKIWTHLGVALLFASPFVGAAVLTLRKAAWYSFLVFATIVVGQNLHSLIFSSSAYNYVGLAQSLVAFVLLAYFLRKDVYAPLLSPQARGWRTHKRVDVSLDVRVEQNCYLTRDVSLSGMFVLWSGCPHAVGDMLKATVGQGADVVELKLKVVRKFDEGIGVMFESLSSLDKSILVPLINRGRQFTRHYFDDLATVAGKKCKVRDISASGLYLEWANCSWSEGVKQQVSLPLGDSTKTLDARVVRVDRNGVALKFEGIAPAEQRALDEWLENAPLLNHARLDKAG